VYSGSFHSALASLAYIKAARLLDHDDHVGPDVALAELVDEIRLLLEPGILPLLNNKLR
jgi:hypothetical protein